jgi:hypothetical protein
MRSAEQLDLDHANSAQLDLAGEASLTTPNPAGDKHAGPQREQIMNIAIVENETAASEATPALIEQIFGDRCRWDRIADVAQAVDLMRQDEHDIYLVCESPQEGWTLPGNAAEFVRSSISSGCHRPIIVLAQNANADLDLNVVDAGAADCIPMGELTPGTLERSIRHALLREHGITRTGREIARLSAEIARLNSLRDANHRFVDNACHDFRSPLTVIKEFSAIIAEGLAGEVNEEQAEFLEIILTRVDQLSQMVDAILDASRLESDLIGVKREEHAPAELIEQAWPTLEQQAGSHGAEIKLSIDGALPNVFADAESVGRILVNLVTNASKFTGEGGKIAVWARRDPNANSVTVGVTDNGPGIAPEHVKIIFDRFQQIENDQVAGKDGFGLGLHIASELARVNFGTLSVESEPQKGSTFAFTLPVFNVSQLIPLHFGFLKTSRHGFQNVSIAAVTAVGEADAATFAGVERFLNRQLRCYDLLLRLSDKAWLACFACDERDMATITDRIRLAYAEHNRNRPDGALPNIAFRPIGSWLLSAPEGLSAAIRSAYALDGEAARTH